MKTSILGGGLLIVAIILSTMSGLIPNALGVCYSSPLVSVGGGTGSGFALYVVSGYGGNTGYQLVTAAHLVGSKGSSTSVTTSCGTFNEKVIYSDPWNSAKGRDLAILQYTGISFSSWYIQGSPFVNENVNISPYGRTSFWGYVQALNFGDSGNYQTAVCTQGNISGVSGSPLTDTGSGKAVGIATSNGGLQTTCGPGTWYYLIAYNGS
jgi:hypothetical protein